MSNGNPAIASRVELMAPAGSLETATVALDSGADALYAGVSGLSMRPKRVEFHDHTFEQLVTGVHDRGKKIYGVVNVFLKEQDWEFFKAKIDEVVSIGPDALIIGDIGAIHYVRSTYPEMPVHVSIQASIANSQAAAFYRDLGASVVVVSRSIGNIEEIARIRRDAPDVDLEVFVHGGICFMYDGNCMMSSYWKQEWAHDPMLGRERLVGQNNTKGECQLVCKRACSLTDGEGDKHADGRLMRRPDQVGLNNLPFYLEQGVKILKIEGRAMPLSYIRESTSLYRKAIDLYYEDPSKFEVPDDWYSEIGGLLEARLQYERQWHIA